MVFTPRVSTGVRRAPHYSDEYAVINKQGHVRPYPKPIHLRGKHAARTKEHAPAAPTGVSKVGPIPVGLVFVSQYKPGTVWQVEEIPADKGILSC